MAHFARIDENSIVREVIVIDNKDCGGGTFPESNPIGQSFIASIGIDGNFEQTSYSGSFRGAYAGFGWTFDADADEFVPPVATEEETN